MFKGINHIGIVVKDIDATLEFMEKAFGAREIRRMSIPEAGQISCMLAIGDDEFELMEPIGDSGVVGKFLASHGEGLHHISLKTDDLDNDKRDNPLIE